MLILVAGAVGAGTFVAPHVPRDRTLELALDDPPSVTAVDVTWSRADGGDALQGGSWRYAAGTAPRSIRASVHLPDGKYLLDVTLERGPHRESMRKPLTLDDADRITVRAR